MKPALPFITTLLLATALSLQAADLRLPSIFSDHMVLQCAKALPVWGWADAGEQIVVEFAGQTKSTTANADGKWTVKLDALEASADSRELVVRSLTKNRSLMVADVLVGEVWLGSGQSNMEIPMSAQVFAKDEVEKNPYPLLRQFIMTRQMSLEPEDHCDGFWAPATPGLTENFSALGYYFGKELQAQLQCPVAVIKASWGGQRAELFLSPKAVAADEGLKQRLDLLRARKVHMTDEFRAWLERSGRSDHETENLAAFTTQAASPESGWMAAKDPGKVIDPAFQYGAFWMRKQVTITSVQRRVPQHLILPTRDVNFYQVYFNGTIIGQTGGKDHLSPARPPDRIYIPPALLREGINELSLRLFVPHRTLAEQTSRFAWPPSMNAVACGGGWQVKAEYSLPPLPASAAPPPIPISISSMGVGASIFNGMIHSLLPYPIRGVIWYQGESNARDGQSYQKLFPLLIQDWRRQWGREDLPFFYCQLANNMEKPKHPDDTGWGFALVREAQRMALSLPHTGMAVLIDTGESNDVHPQSKDIAGRRLANVALARTYGRSVPFSGPVFDSMKVEHGRIRVTFRHAADGLVARDVPATYEVMRKAGKTAPLLRNSPGSEVEGFAICGADRKWVWANAKIEGETVVVWSKQVPSPMAVRYAFADNPTVNLYNRAGLPASPFRTDDFPVKTGPTP